MVKPFSIRRSSQEVSYLLLISQQILVALKPWTFFNAEGLNINDYLLLFGLFNSHPPTWKKLINSKDGTSADTSADSWNTKLSYTLYLKVKCNEIWTIFLFSKNLHKKVSYANRKQNQLSKISFVRPMAPKTRKSDDFRELHENEPEMAALGVVTKL